MKEPSSWRTRRTTLLKRCASARVERGAGLIAVLLATLLLSAGTAAVIRWSAILLLGERDQALRFEVLRTLSGVLETGVLESSPGPAGESPAGQAVAGDVPIRITLQDQRAEPGSDTAPGVYRTITATWAGPHGTPERLSLHTFWYPGRRIY